MTNQSMTSDSRYPLALSGLGVHVGCEMSEQEREEQKQEHDEEAEGTIPAALSDLSLHTRFRVKRFVRGVPMAPSGDQERPVPVSQMNKLRFRSEVPSSHG